MSPLNDQAHRLMVLIYFSSLYGSLYYDYDVIVIIIFNSTFNNLELVHF